MIQSNTKKPELQTENSGKKQRRNKTRCIHYFSHGSCGCQIGALHLLSECGGSNKCDFYKKRENKHMEGENDGSGQ